MLGAEAIADVYKSESPAWGKRGFLMEKRRVGTARFMSRSTAADKGSTDNGAGSGPRHNFVGKLVGVPKGVWGGSFARPLA
jgi:hypothetical protein